MVLLRADPWSPDYGVGFDVDMDEEPPPRVDPLVETVDWTRPITPEMPEPRPVWFVDGVRRVELRLIAAEGAVRAPGLFGTLAVGSVLCEDRASFGEHRTRRAVVIGAGIHSPDVRVRVGGTEMTFEPVAEPGSEPDRPLWRLQQLMREAEANLAASLAARAGCVVVVDGPLTFRDPTTAPVVGLVKRFSRRYLDETEESLVGRLGAGQRTPLFGVGDDEQPVQRYAWYSRLVELGPPWHDHAGVVRGEVRAGVGLASAAGLADRFTATLPRYAGRASDPRAPQNLAPVGGLEIWLRHRMGEHGLVRRALIDRLAEEAG